MGGSVTAEYWQFVPHGDTMDIASLASHQGKDGSQTPLSGLQTPPSAFERRRSSMHQLARAISQPSLAESSSPVSSFYLQRQASGLPPYPDAIPPNSTELQRATSRTQQLASTTPSELDAIPHGSSDWQQHPASNSWQQHLQYTSPVHSHQHRGSFWASQKQWSSNLGPMPEPHAHIQQPQPQQQQQQQAPAAPAVVQQEARGPGTAAAASVPQIGLFSEPPSASWGRALPADSHSDQQMALNFSSLAIAGPRDLSGTHLMQ